MEVFLFLYKKMQIRIENIHKLIVVGDKVLVKKSKNSERTKTGLLLPPGLTEKEEIQSGYIIKVGPGYPVMNSEDENWKEKQVKYLPLQAKEGDLAIFLKNQTYEIEFEKEKYYIVPNTAILLLYRDE
jgi:co-chaperonin GroES (HSP10)